MILTPYVRFAIHHTWLDNNYINRSIWDHEFIFIEHGSIKITVNGETYVAKENDCIVLRPNVHHILEWNGETCCQPHVHFDFFYQEDSEKVGISFDQVECMTAEEKTYFRPDFFKENNINMPCVLHLNNPIQFKNILYQIIEEFTYKKEYSEFILQGLMAELIGIVLRNSSPAKDIEAKDEQLSNIVICMNENIDNNLSLDDFADMLHISKWTLIQSFNENYHCSPIKYYNKLKHIRAKELILYTFLTISEISQKMNFAEPQTFSRWFKKMDGSYPSAYRKNRNK